jgi:farnesyl diphosphate synthase
MPADSLFPAWASRVEAALDRALPQSTHSPRLDAAMRHAALGGGKRLRPMLAYAAGSAFGASDESLDAAATAVELIHAFSLVHDDLPAMDDDDLRRGRPTVHVAFDVATAILAGDALQALAFEVLASAPLDAGIRIALVGELARASGACGMCAGQALDMAATGQALDLPHLEHLHSLKTGALIRAAVRMGALSARAPEASLKSLDQFADALGLAFQIRDDILDVESNSAQLGKTAGKDQAQGKSTYPGLLGIVDSRQKLEALAREMKAALEPLGPSADALRALADFAIARAN